MKLEGSKTAKLRCYECDGESQPFRVTFAVDETKTEGRYLRHIWLPKDNVPAGWFVDEDAKLQAFDENGHCTDLSKVEFATIFARCPSCRQD